MDDTKRIDLIKLIWDFMASIENPMVDYQEDDEPELDDMDEWMDEDEWEV